MLILSRRDVEELLDLDRLLEVLADVHVRLSAGAASLPPRIAATVPERDGLLLAMPGRVPAVALGCKLVSVFPRNVGVETHHALIALFDEETGEPTAVLDGGYITGARTAAAAALAMRALARPEAGVLAILGTGVQARWHHTLFTRVRAWAEIRIAGRTRETVESFAAEVGARPMRSWQEAVRGADVVAAATHAVEPVVRRDWLAPGTHVSSVGFNPAGREVDEATVRDAKVVVELRAAALAPPPSGAAELLGIERVHAELGEILSGVRPGRESPTEITLYKSVGVAAQDLAAAALVVEAARGR